MKYAEEKKIWFPAKKYGFGWTFPNCWQGWVVLVIYIACVTAWSITFNPVNETVLFAVGLILISAALVFLCWLKGEKSRWRLGE
jgi:hypothetical protein